VGSANPDGVRSARWAGSTLGVVRSARTADRPVGLGPSGRGSVRRAGLWTGARILPLAEVASPTGGTRFRRARFGHARGRGQACRRVSLTSLTVAPWPASRSVTRTGVTSMGDGSAPASRSSPARGGLDAGREARRGRAAQQERDVQAVGVVHDLVLADLEELRERRLQPERVHGDLAAAGRRQGDGVVTAAVDGGDTA
jgi:hypothetical protein